jgi:hypothetical protein
MASHLLCSLSQTSNSSGPTAVGSADSLNLLSTQWRVLCELIRLSDSQGV